MALPTSGPQERWADHYCPIRLEKEVLANGQLLSAFWEFREALDP